MLRTVLRLVFLGTYLSLAIPVQAQQILPDSSLNTQVTRSLNDFTITGGTTSGTNLFHSFQEFSIPTGGSAIFNNATNIQNIFSRVTGGTVSNIDGLLKANGTANLFLLNPNGILFGANARLNLGGSFLGTTANRLRFADGTEWSADTVTAPPLLTMSVPVGLQMGSNPASITVQGTGHALSNPNPNGLPPITVAPSATELRVQPGQTLALVGGNLTLDGATLTAPQGRVELGSVSGAGLISLIPIAQGYRLEYGQGQSFGDIQLAQKSLIDVSGINAGSVQLQGRQIQFTDGSTILSQNFGYLPGGEIHLQASSAIDMIGATDSRIWSGVRSETFGIAAGSNVSVITPKLTVQAGAGLNTSTIGTATSGNIDIQASAIEVSGSSLSNPRSVSSLSTSSYYSSGNAGDILVNGDSLVVSGGASLSSATFGSGASGEVTIRNNQTILTGGNGFGFQSAISSVTFATGTAKALTLDTARLQILDGGTLAATTFFMGNGGDLRINATESIEIRGYNQSNNSSLNSSVLSLNPQLRQQFGLPDILIANAGSVSISTPNLILTDRGTVSVTNQGDGNGGTLSIKANTIQLDHQASIQAQTASGNGGNIDLAVGKLLLLRNNSTIAATAGEIATTAGGKGDGGNININAPIIVGVDNSDIVANASNGRGGNINIQTQGIFGLKFRDQQTPENDITASSGIGVNGTVEVKNVGVDPNSGLVELSTTLIDSNQQVATACSGTQGSSFVITGRGGIPQNPTQAVSHDRSWNDMRDLSTFHKPTIAQTSTPTPTIVQATSWQRNPQTGKVELLAIAPTEARIAATCAALSK
jgi:filamentous hemagglutinin family protein